MGGQWNALNLTGLCTSSSAHRRFQEWSEAGVFERLWAQGLSEYDELVGLDWQWLSMDAAMTKAPGVPKTESAETQKRGRRTRRSAPAPLTEPSPAPSAAC